MWRPTYLKSTNHDLKKSLSIVEVGVAKANDYTIVDPEACTGCSLCKYRCQVGACSMDDDIATIDLSKCIGCGICVTSCPNDAITLKLKPDAEIVPHL